jgi:hypothetical protein
MTISSPTGSTVCSSCRSCSDPRASVINPCLAGSSVDSTSGCSCPAGYFGLSASCSACPVGQYSTFGSSSCEVEDSIISVYLTFTTSTALTQELQIKIRSGISQTANVPVSQVYIASFTQGRRMVSSRLLLQVGSVLEVNAEIKTIKSMLQSAVNGLSNKAALDASFVQAGLPASTALKTQLYCGAGQYSAQAASSCTMCSAGTYSSVVGLVTSCQSCAVGQFANSSGSTKCSSVTSGHCHFQIKFYLLCAASRRD